MAVTGQAEPPRKVQKFGDKRLREASVAFGTTANRPVLTTSDIGFLYTDTTLGSTIIWGGTDWVSLLPVCNNDSVICHNDNAVYII